LNAPRKRLIALVGASGNRTPSYPLNPFGNRPCRSPGLVRFVKPECVHKSLAHAARTPLHASPGPSRRSGCRASAFRRANNLVLAERGADSTDPLRTFPPQSPGQSREGDQHRLTWNILEPHRPERGQQEGHWVSTEVGPGRGFNVSRNVTAVPMRLRGRMGRCEWRDELRGVPEVVGKRPSRLGMVNQVVAGHGIQAETPPPHKGASEGVTSFVNSRRILRNPSDLAQRSFLRKAESQSGQRECKHDSHAGAGRHGSAR
jgi:hypothetical protein